MRRYTRPEPLASDHEVEQFSSGNAILDSWLRGRAHRNEMSGASRTFVTCAIETRVVHGYYTLAASAVTHAEAPGHVRRNMPDPIPAILLGRLAVDRPHDGAGLGSSLLQDAILRVAGAADTVGVRALLVHAIDDAAAAFYGHFGFRPSPLDDQTLLLTMSEIRAGILAASGRYSSTPL